MQHVGGRERLERGPARIPARAELLGNPAKSRVTCGSWRCDANKPKRPSKTARRSRRPGPSQKRRGDAALRGPSRMQEFRLRPIHPALENARGKTAADASRPRQRVGVEAQQLAGEVGDAERREQSARMESETMELAGRDAADAARDLVADGDCGDQIAPGHGTCTAEPDARLSDGVRRRAGRSGVPDRVASASPDRRAIVRQGERRRHRRAAHVDDRFVVRVVVFQRLRPRAVHECRRRHAEAHSPRRTPGTDRAATMAVAASRTERPNAVSAPASDKPMTSSTRFFVASTTSGGRSSNVVRHTHRPSFER